MSPSLRVLGVMTGTSCDGLDAACVEIDAGGWTPLWSGSSVFPKDLRNLVLEYQKPSCKLSAYVWLDLHRSLGEWYGTTLARLIKKNRAAPDAIANHGQTIAHFPAPGGKGITLQLGDPARIAHETGLTVISNFRDGDLAAGGQGAPLAPLFHQMLSYNLPALQKGAAIHNIGGISNFTYLGPRRKIIAFDTGPGNIWIDAAATLATGGNQKMDTGGKLAQRGVVDTAAVEAVLEHPFFNQAPQKSTGRDDFPFEYLTSRTSAQGASLVATATAVTVESIARAYEKRILAKHLPLRAILVCGGGAKNLFLMDALTRRLPDIEVLTTEQAGIDGQLLEAQAFAFFGFLSLLGQPLGGPWTGVKGFGPPGHLIPGQNWGAVVQKVAAFRKLV